MNLRHKPLYFLLLLLLLAGMVAGVILTRQRQVITKKGAPATQLSLITDNYVKNNQEFTLSVNIDTGGNQVVGTELYINYDPAFLEPLSASKGSLMQQADVIGPEFDSSTGEVFYTLIIKPNDTPITGTGTIAQITFKPIKTGSTSLSLNQDKTLAVAVGEGSINVITKYSPTVVNIYDTYVSLSMTSDKPSYGIGEAVTIPITVDNGGADVAGIELYLKYDADVIEYIKLTQNDYLTNPDVVGPVVDQTGGIIHYTQMLPPEVHNTKEQGIMATLTFKAKKQGQATVNFIEGQTIAVAYGSLQQNILKSVTNAQFIVRALPTPTPTIVPEPTPTIAPTPTISPTPTAPSYIDGDINRDGTVNILDYALLFEYFTQPASAYPNADINSDGIINLLDYIILFENFGKSL